MPKATPDLITGKPMEKRLTGTATHKIVDAATGVHIGWVYLWQNGERSRAYFKYPTGPTHTVLRQSGDESVGNNSHQVA